MDLNTFNYFISYNNIDTMKNADYNRIVYSYMHLLHGGFYMHMLDKYIEPKKSTIKFKPKIRSKNRR